MAIHPHYISENVSLQCDRERNQRSCNSASPTRDKRGCGGNESERSRYLVTQRGIPDPSRDGGQRTPAVRRCGRPAHDNGGRHHHCGRTTWRRAFLRADKMYQKGDDFRPADAAPLLGRHVQNMRRQLTAQADSEGVDAPTGAVARRAGSIRPVRVQSRGVGVAMCSDGLNPTTRR